MDRSYLLKSLKKAVGRKEINLTLVVLLLVGIIYLTVTNPVQNRSSESFTVVDVVDGDTVKVEDELGEQYTVRMIGIDTPERGECGYELASDALEQKVLGRTVLLEADPSQNEKDRYGRILRYVVDERRNINQEMVEEGYAREYTYDKEYLYAEQFREGERSAQERRVGIWGRCDLLPSN